MAQRVSLTQTQYNQFASIESELDQYRLAFTLCGAKENPPSNLAKGRRWLGSWMRLNGQFAPGHNCGAGLHPTTRNRPMAVETVAWEARYRHETTFKVEM